jgi:CzcA family heavy metal efflux pump
MRWIVGSSLKFRFLVVAGASALMFFGVGALRNSPVDVFPEFAPPKVEVQTISLGLSSTEVENLVTVPLEQALNGLPGLDILRSKSVPQLSQLELVFKRDVDLLRARQLVSERINTITPTLPTWAAPPVMIQPLSATSRVMKIGLSSKTMSLIDMSTLSYWKIRARLLRVPGVANVPIWGERLQQLHVQVDPGTLNRNGVSLLQLMQTTADALDAGLLQFSDGAVIGTGGFIDTPNQRLTVRHKLPIVTPQNLADVVLIERGTKTLTLGEVARVVEDHQPLLGDAIINDGPGLMLIIEKLPWANTLDVTRGVEEALREMRPGLPGLEIDTTIFRPATFIEEAINNLGVSLLIGAVLMILMLGLFLFEWRVALISVIAIPLSLVAAGLILHLRGATINTMILAGFVIALGDIVDDAIIDIENVVRRLRQHRREGGTRSTARIILEASLEVRSAIVYATLIEVAAILPIFFLQGLSGAFFRPLAISYALALLVSMGVALTVTPALSLILLRKARLEDRESPIVPPLQRGYAWLLSRIVSRPRGSFAGVGALVLIGLAALPFLGQSLLPSFKERDFLMHWVTEPSTSGIEEARITTAASKELRAIPGVRNFGAHIGNAFLGDEPYGIYFGENWISVDPKADYDATLGRIQEVVDGYPGLRRDVQTYLKERIREVLTGSSEAILILIFGEDLDVLQAKGEEVRTMLGNIDGVIEEHVELQKKVPQLEVEVDLEKAARFGIKPGDVRRAAAALMASEEVGDIFHEGKAFDVHVFSTPENRNSVTSLRRLLIDTPSGKQVRLEDVADVRLAPTPNQVHRESLSRTIEVGANVQGRDLGAVVRDVENGLKNIDFPLGYHAEMFGEFQERKAAQNRLMTFAILGAVGVFLLLQTSFGSWRLATLSFVTLPMALIGGVMAAFLGGRVISLGSLVGFFTVLGIVARNGIMLISHYQHLERHEGVPFGRDLVIQGAKERLSPILMTVFTTGLALVPLLIAGNRSGAGDRVPDGDRDPRGPRDVHAVEPVRGAVAVSEVRKEPGTSDRRGPRMRRIRRVTLAVAASVLLLAGACSDKAGIDAGAAKAPFPVNFDPKIFGKDSATITNPYFPLKPGTQWTWQGKAMDGEDEIARGLISTVTDLTKTVGGVNTRVVWERDFNDGTLAEAELVFLAQDKDGNVWHFGQYSEIYDEEGVLDGGTAWLVGHLQGAKAGILVPANPKAGTPAYAEGFAPAPYFWDDYGRVSKTGAKTCVLTGCYDDVVVIEEFEPTKPDAFQLKFYARGVGNVRTGWRGKGEGEQETLELVKLTTLDAAGLAEARAAALTLDGRARLYGGTGPLAPGNAAPA